MKNLYAILLAFALSGCCAFTEVGKFDPRQTFSSDDGDKAVAVINVANVSYSLFGLIPIESGKTWQSGGYDENHGKWNATFFQDNCSVDENLASVRTALKYLGKDRIANLTNDEDAWSFWSLFIVRRKVVKTSCVVFD